MESISDMECPRFDASAVSIEPNIFVFGGKSSIGVAINSIEIFNGIKWQ